MNIKEELIYVSQNLISRLSFCRLFTIKSKKILTEITMKYNFISVNLSITKRDYTVQYWLCWKNLYIYQLQMEMQIIIVWRKVVQGCEMSMLFNPLIPILWLYSEGIISKLNIVKNKFICSKYELWFFIVIKYRYDLNI